MSHKKLFSVFTKIHESFVDELKQLMGRDDLEMENGFASFASSVDVSKLIEKKATSLDVKDFASLEVLPSLKVESFANKISTIDLVRTFFVYVIILAAIVVKTKDEDDADDDAFIHALQLARKGASYDYRHGGNADGDISHLLESLRDLNVGSSSTDSDSKDIDDEEADDATPLPDLDMAFLEKSKIGQIAKEISEEIDLSNITKPEDVLNFSDPKNNVIGNIVNKVGSKIHNKLNNGEIKQEDLLSEAFGLLNSFGGKIPGGGNIADILKNPMMKNMMNSMAGQFGGGSGGGKRRAAVNTSKLNQMSTRERLRTKLQSKHKTEATE